MSTPLMPELPEPPNYESAYDDAPLTDHYSAWQMRAYGLAVWKAAMEQASDVAKDHAALDNLTECAAMLMNMAGRVAASGVPGTFWLIERGTNQRQSPTMWWSGEPDAGVSSYSWVESVHKATRFDSAEAAEAMAKARYVTHYAVTGHNFVDIPAGAHAALDKYTSPYVIGYRDAANTIASAIRALPLPESDMTQARGE